MIKIEHTPVKDVNGKIRGNTSKIIGKIIMGIGILLAIVGGAMLVNNTYPIYINHISMILLVLGIILFFLGIPIITITRFIGKMRREIEKAELAFGPVDERALDGYERVISKYRVFLIKKKSKFEYKVMTPSEIVLGHFEREGKIISTLYLLKNLEGLPLLTIRKKFVRYIFYEGGEEDESKLIGTLKHPKWMGKPKYWFEDPYEKKIIIMKGQGFYLYHLIKDNLKETLVFKIGSNSIKVKIKPYIPDNIVILILGITAILQIEDDRAQLPGG